MRVLVTGANGFVGRVLCARLRERGHTVIEAAGPAPGAHGAGFDLRSDAAVRRTVDDARAEAVAHLAAQAFVPAAIADPWTTHDVNAGGTLRLLEALRAARAAGAPDARVLLVGSADVYGHVAPGPPLTERTPLAPANPYAASKVASEAYGLAAAASYGLRVIAVRAFNHIGPGQDRRFAIASFALQLARIAGGGDRVLRVGNLEAERDFLDVRDVVEAYVALLEGGGSPGEVYNVASGRARTMREMLRELITVARVPVEIRDDPERMRPSDTPRLVGDAAKLRAATGWTPRIALGASLRAIWNDAVERVAADAHANPAVR